MVHEAGPGFALPEGFLMGASTSAHQVEGNNVSSDWWTLENHPESFVQEPSGDAADSFHRWPEDMDLLRELGFDSYRFSIEWARVEPERGRISRAALAHYRAMVRGALERGLTPVVTLHHFTSPQWFSELGGWTAPGADELFAAYARTCADVLREGVRHVATINEPNIMALMYALKRHAAEHGWESIAHGANAAREAGAAAVDPASFAPDPEVIRALIGAHRAATAALKETVPGVQVGWTVANQVYQPEPGCASAATAYARPREDVFLEAAREDDWIGVQAYTRHRIGPEGTLPPPPDAELTLTGWEFYPEALGEAVRHTAEVVGPHVPILVTENGIATDDDERRIAYTTRALASLAEAMADGVDVRGYLHWSALDNYEWGSYRPTFGLIAVDRDTFARTPKESARRLGALSRERRLPAGDPLGSVTAPSSR
ncbi:MULTISPECIES: glycoside hydrolase family 1 protein [unclassified Streptomyces]|uniref:glycoside hydrolase family 1 protein n=1 Tax=unclassified Streptomyces TaxID=2593676 RepID=UPI000380E7C6|nr:MULTISPECIES: family 1 glycosylhydrolase [unclassified Streptomyces]MYQ76421.1 family 1 glycosylhydrolase [Streptomyces sp. SID4923]